MSQTLALVAPSPHSSSSNPTSLGKLQLLKPSPSDIDMNNDSENISINIGGKENIPILPQKELHQSPIKPSESNKRGPSTPLAPSRHPNIIRRKVSPGLDYDLNIKSKFKMNLIDIPYNDKIYKTDYIETQYQNWLLQRRIDRQERILKFLEIERKFEKEFGMNQ